MVAKEEAENSSNKKPLTKELNLPMYSNSTTNKNIETQRAMVYSNPLIIRFL
jgi:hypothetical protein